MSKRSLNPRKKIYLKMFDKYYSIPLSNWYSVCHRATKNDGAFSIDNQREKELKSKPKGRINKPLNWTDFDFKQELKYLDKTFLYG